LRLGRSPASILDYQPLAPLDQRSATLPAQRGSGRELVGWRRQHDLGIGGAENVDAESPLVDRDGNVSPGS
jgi:hypothetical protein